MTDPERVPLYEPGDDACRRLIRELPAAIYVCDAEGRVQSFNESAVELWGRRPVVGVDRWSDSIRLYKTDGSPLPADRCAMAITLKEARPVPGIEIIIERADGHRRNVLPFPTPLFDSAGKLVGAVNMLVDITQRDDQRKIADIAQARLGAIVESSDDAIVSKTLDGIITSWNRSAERIFGYTSEEAIGQSILLIVPADRRAEEATIISRLRSGQRIEHFETQRVTKDGRLLDISLTVSPVRDGTGVIVGASKVARDISDKKRVEEERERLLQAERYAREEAQRVNRMKDEFLQTLSHELRTPLSAIMGWAHILATGQLSATEAAEAGRVVERNARTQKQLIDDLLDMSRIVSGKLRLDVQRVDPASIVQSAIDTIRPAADAKDIRIESLLDPSAGPISGDPARLQQIVWNLLINAIKFTPKGGKAQVSLARVNSHIELTVADNGQGIKPEFLPQLFTRFSQEDASANRKHGGLGLGLAIVKQLVELHGGTVRAKSAGEGKGAAFIVELPLMLVNHEETANRVHPRYPTVPEPFQTGSFDFTGLHVLVVDDEPDARSLIKRLLTEVGAEISTADSARNAMAVLATKTPDLLISDIGMPDVDGYEFLRTLRRLDTAAAKIPAIALTAFARSEDRTRALRAGYIAHVAKPVEPSELLATIAVVAGRTIQEA